ncbi:hypothetical protein O1L60_04315 [Streptomyces diastatochromogenes]|nr:hypothetical protein [Streptomyces diastatochromogenes]
MAETANLTDVVTLADLAALLKRLGLEELWDYAVLTKEASLLGGPEALRRFHQTAGAQAAEAALRAAFAEAAARAAAAHRTNLVGTSIVGVTVGGLLVFAYGKWSARRTAAQAATEALASEQIEQAQDGR